MPYKYLILYLPVLVTRILNISEIIFYMMCPICYFVRFAIQPREWKNLENGSKNVENAFENDLKLSRMHLKTRENGIKNV